MNQRANLLVLPPSLMRKVQFAKDQNRIKSNDVLRTILDCTDLTSLTGKETEQDIRLLCQKATLYGVASVCVMHKHVKTAVSYLKDTGINVATVINYPYGNKRTGTEEEVSVGSTIQDIEFAIKDGAKQVDIVYPFTEPQCTAREILNAARCACPENIMLKAILETAIYSDIEDLQDVSELAIACGIDCLKTSTGKHSLGGATPEAVAVMMDVIKKEKKQIGVKITGGLSSIEDCIPYLALRKLFFGASNINPHNFRFGASRLLDNIASQFTGAAVYPEGEDQMRKPKGQPGLKLVTFG